MAWSQYRAIGNFQNRKNGVARDWTEVSILLTNYSGHSTSIDLEATTKQDSKTLDEEITSL